MILFNNVRKSFGKLDVLKGITLSLSQGEVIALIGPNGSGKTTLIKCLLGLVSPGYGNIIFNEKDIRTHWNYRKSIGYMPQISRYPEHMTIGQVFRMMLDLRGNPVNADKELIDSFGLESLYNKPMGSLSGGTRQKVSAAIAFLFNPDVLILDEPTAGLDPVSAEIFKQKIRKSVAENKLILITTHNLTEVDELADKVIFLYEGEVKFSMTVDEIRNQTGENTFNKAIAKLTSDVRYE
jgi:Cu-processing system ATP-binding protein